MSTETDTKSSLHDRIESQVQGARARLDALKVKATSNAAKAELKLIAGLLASQRILEAKLSELKKSNQAANAQAKTDIESRIADLERKAQAVEARFETA